MPSKPAGLNAGQEPLSFRWVAIAILLLPPLGIYLLWRHPVLNERATWRTVAYAWCAFWVLIQISNVLTGGRGVNERQSTNQTSAQVEAIEDPQLPEKMASSNRNGPNSAKPFFAAGEMAEIVRKADSLELGDSRSEAISLLGRPNIQRDGGDWEFLVWSMDKKEQRLCVTVGVDGDRIKSLTRRGERLFERQDMVSLLKKAQTLRLGMIRQEVINAMGTPSSTDDSILEVVSSVDTVTEEVSMMKKKLSVLTWSSADDEDRFVMVGLDNGAMCSVECNQPGRGTVYELKR